MYKLLDRFKRNAQKYLEESVAKSSMENSKQGKNKIKFFVLFEIKEKKTF